MPAGSSGRRKYPCTLTEPLRLQKTSNLVPPPTLFSPQAWSVWEQCYILRA